MPRPFLLALGARRPRAPCSWPDGLPAAPSGRGAHYRPRSRPAAAALLLTAGLALLPLASCGGGGSELDATCKGLSPTPPDERMVAAYRRLEDCTGLSREPPPLVATQPAVPCTEGGSKVCIAQDVLLCGTERCGAAAVLCGDVAVLPAGIDEIQPAGPARLPRSVKLYQHEAGHYLGLDPEHLDPRWKECDTWDPLGAG